MRAIVLDTETTGLNANDGDRIIEIACVEIIDRQLSGAAWHCYLDPERDITAAAFAVHGLSRAFLQGKPKFRDIVHDLRKFIADSALIIHNARFDLNFLNAECARLQENPLRQLDENVIDTWKLARSLYPGKRNSLDALCERLSISLSQRQKHGAAIDAQLLAKAYLAMTREQHSLAMPTHQARAEKMDYEKLSVKVILANDNERHAHEEIWKKLHMDTPA